MRRTLASALVFFIAVVSGLLLPSQSLGFASARQEQAATADADAPAPADLRLEWLLEDGVVAEAPVVQGAPGEVVELAYRLRNVGGQEAFAAVVRADTALGPVGAAERLEPGPEAGKSFRRVLALPLAEGMRELCLQARLQNRRAEDPPDPNPDDNRVCRRVVVDEGASVPPGPVPIAYTPPWAARLVGGEL
jgi:hypothetical protein